MAERAQIDALMEQISARMGGGRKQAPCGGYTLFRCEVTNFFSVDHGNCFKILSRLCRRIGTGEKRELRNEN
jgi:hypothetical protein